MQKLLCLICVLAFLAPGHASTGYVPQLQALYRSAKRWKDAYVQSLLRDGFTWQLPSGGLPKPPGCPQLEGYHFVPQRSYDKYDLFKPCGLSGGSPAPAKVAAICAQTPYCQGFTTEGMLKFRIPPGELGTGKPPAQVRPVPCRASPGRLCRKRQLLQVDDALDKEDYNQWKPVANPGANKCAGTYVSKFGEFEQWLRAGVQPDDQVVAKSSGALQRESRSARTYRLLSSGRVKAASSAFKGRPVLKGNKRSVAAPLDALVNKQIMPQLAQEASKGSEQPPSAADLMLSLALPAAYDSSQPSSTGGFNFVPPPRDQGKCGTCTAFAATGLARIAMAAAKRQNVLDVPALSPQHLYFCADSEATNRLCLNGTTMDSALRSISNGGALQESCLPYTAMFTLPNNSTTRPPGICKQRCATKPGGKFEWGVLDSVARAKEEIAANGAVASVMVLYPDVLEAGRCRPDEAYATRDSIPDQLAFEFHAVLVVGWSDDAGYWLITSSWGAWPGGSKPGLFKVKFGEAALMTPGLMYWMRWSGPGAQPRALNPAFITQAGGGCSWYTAQPGDTLAGVARRLNISLQQLLAVNDDASLLAGGPIAGKRIRICNM